jgi:large subunit ribosomal protein L29
MKPHEVRGLPIDEMKGMLADAEANLLKMRFQHGVGQLDNKLALRESRKDIAMLKTLIKEEETKSAFKKADEMLSQMKSKLTLPEIDRVIETDRINLKKSRLRRLLLRLQVHPKKSEFQKEYVALKQLAN